MPAATAMSSTETSLNDVSSTSSRSARHRAARTVSRRVRRSSTVWVTRVIVADSDTLFDGLFDTLSTLLLACGRRGIEQEGKPTVATLDALVAEQVDPGT